MGLVDYRQSRLRRLPIALPASAGSYYRQLLMPALSKAATPLLKSMLRTGCSRSGGAVKIERR
jgi:hypothetical protein